MTQDPNAQAPFKRDVLVDKPGIVGARWWQESIADPVSRRSAVTGIIVASSLVAGLGAVFTMCGVAASSRGSTGATDDVKFDDKRALELQREYGWNFGAVGEPLTFDGVTTSPFVAETLDTLDADLAPADPRLLPYHVPTLLQSPSAVARSTPPGETPSKPLKTELRPYTSTATELAFARGKALASLFELATAPRDVAVVVDMLGPEAVAFAAGAASVFEPVFAVDNWPHPRGIVPAHLTVATAAYYQPLFKRARTERKLPARPLFVLDRARLSPYVDAADKFDNRHIARLPSASNLAAMGIKRILYVVPSDGDSELDDLNDTFANDAAAKIDVRLVAGSSFAPGGPLADAAAAQGNSEPRYYYGGDAGTHYWFWRDYPWVASPPASRALPRRTMSSGWSARPRVTPYSSGTTSSPSPRTPTSFGVVPVAVAVGTGVVLGARWSRSGSWNRSSSSSSGS